MAFESGSPSFMVFKCGEEMSGSLIDAFRAKMAPPIESLSTSPIEGWVGWRHLLDRDLDEENCLFVPWIYVNSMRAERKIPKALLRAYCRMEEAEELRARNVEFLPAAVKAEIRERVTERMLPEMPPTLTGCGTVVDLSNGLIYHEATSQKAAETFAQAFRDATGHAIAALSPQGAAVLRKGVNQTDLQPANFTDDPTIELPTNCDLGLEFLTWLWFTWETEGDSFMNSRGETLAFAMQGPVAFFNEGRGAHNVVLRNGLPLQSREAGAAMLCGKKVSKIRISMGDDLGAWSATIDSAFAIRNLKLPKDPREPRQSFHERMALVETFVESLLSLYDKFLDRRADAREWGKVEAAMRVWTRRRAEIGDGNVAQ